MAQTDNNARTGCGCLAFLAVVVIIVVAISSSGGSKSSSSSSGGGVKAEARAYIHEWGKTINYGRVDYEHIQALVGILKLAGTEAESTEVVNEIAKSAQEAHDEIDDFRNELFTGEGDDRLKKATFTLSEGANELKNSMGSLVTYTGNPNPATLARWSTQLEAAKAKWNEGVDEIWTLAGMHGAYRLK